MLVKYQVVMPGVPGADITYPNRTMAEREQRNAQKAGFTADVVEVMVIPRTTHNVLVTA